MFLITLEIPGETKVLLVSAINFYYVINKLIIYS
jgi:hypothetical protein